MTVSKLILLFVFLSISAMVKSETETPSSETTIPSDDTSIPSNDTTLPSDNSTGLWSDPVKACLKELNNDNITAGITLEECKQKCLSATSYVCKSFDFAPPGNGSECFLSEETKKTQPTAYTEPCYDGSDSVYIERIFDDDQTETPSSETTTPSDDTTSDDTTSDDTTSDDTTSDDTTSDDTTKPSEDTTTGATL